VKERKMSGSPPKHTICTAFTDPPERCGRRDLCIRVITRSRTTGATLHKHWVCTECRKRMGLPEHSVIITP
jgi:hypothetical protein